MTLVMGGPWGCASSSAGADIDEPVGEVGEDTGAGNESGDNANNYSYSNSGDDDTEYADDNYNYGNNNYDDGENNYTGGGYQNNYSQEYAQNNAQNYLPANNGSDSHASVGPGAGEELSFNASQTAPVTGNSPEAYSGSGGYYEGYNSGGGYNAAEYAGQNNFAQNLVATTIVEESPLVASEVEIPPRDSEEIMVAEGGRELSDQGFQMPVVMSTLRWLGYDYRSEEGVVRVEMVTEGSPRYSLYRTEGIFPQIIVRFYNTRFIGRLERDIDASEFVSPVAYIRTVENHTLSSADIIITLRELIPMKLFAQNGNLLATFEMPEKYYGNSSISEVKSDYAITLGDPLYAQFIDSSQYPDGLDPMDLTSGAFNDVPLEGGEEIISKRDISATGAPRSPEYGRGDGRPSSYEVGRDSAGGFDTVGDRNAPREQTIIEYGGVNRNVFADDYAISLDDGAGQVTESNLVTD